MKQRFVPLFSLLLACCLGRPALLDGEEVATYTIQRTSSPPTIDGQLDDAVWQATPSVGNFVFPWWESGEREQTVAKLLWDDKHLYVYYQCADAHIWAEQRERDGNVYEDDCVEVFTSPDVDQSDRYFNIEMNVRGAFLDQYHPDGPNPADGREWTASGVKIATTIDGTLNDDSDTDLHWTLEAAIPFANFVEVAKRVPPRAGDVWRLNLNRLGGKTNPQFSQWSPSKTDKPQFHVPRDFGRVTFSETAR